MSSRGRMAWGAFVSIAAAVLALAVVTISHPNGVFAARDERTLTLYEIHTRVTTTVTFKRDGEFVPEALEKLNWAVRDWRRNEPTKMDPKVFDLVWELHKELGSAQPVHVVSGYRSPTTNEKLRRAGGGQAKQSQHTLGRAMDVHFPDISMRQVRNSALVREWGGVGYYPTSAIPFVHIDTGRVRAWPRLPRQELAMLFPNRGTRHVPADGRPLDDDDRRKARIVLAQLERQKKSETLLARAEQNAPAVSLAARQPAQRATAVAALEQRPSRMMPVPGLSDLGQHSQNLWYFRAGGAAMLQAAFNPDRPASTGPAARVAAASLPAMRAPSPQTKPAVKTSRPDRPQLASLTSAPAAQAAPDHEQRLWVNGAEQRRALVTASLLPPIFGGGRERSAGAAERVAALVASDVGSRPAVPDGYRYRQEEDVSYAPEFDDDHPDELSYRPFQILPLMSTEPIIRNTRVVAMVEPKYSHVMDLLAASENYDMQFRPSPAAAEMRWMGQFRGSAIIKMRPRAESAPTSPPLNQLAMR